MGQTDFNMDSISTEIGMSRTSFYMKLKSLTGLSPLQFVNNYRVQKGQNLLSSGEYSVKQVAYIVGYDTTKSFSRNFKKQTGKTPSEFLMEIFPDKFTKEESIEE